MYADVYELLFEIVTFFNRSKQDAQLLQKAGIQLDTALFPLLMRIAHHKTASVGQLAEQVNRNYSTISRHVDTLVSLELVVEIETPSDKRVRRVMLTEFGQAIAKSVLSARRVEMRNALQTWSEQDLQTLRHSLEHLVATIGEYSRGRSDAISYKKHRS